MSRLIYKNIMCFNIPIIPTIPGEIFVPVTDYAVSDIYNCYKVSNYGRVFNCITRTFINNYIAYGNYLSVSLATINGYKSVLLHRLMMLSFYPIDDPDLYQVNHKDGNKMHNELYNLEWVTRSENIIHAYNTGLHHRGEDNASTTISNETAIAICEKLQEGIYTNEQIANMYNTTECVVSDIKQGHSWKFISKDYIFHKRPGRLLTDDDVELLCQYFQDFTRIGTINDYCRDALKYIGIEPEERIVETVRKIYARKYYINISNKYLF